MLKASAFQKSLGYTVEWVQSSGFGIGLWLAKRPKVPGIFLKQKKYR